MAEASGDLERPDFEKGCKIDQLADEEMLLGHAFGEPVLVARRGDELFAIGATCTHYGGPLAKGLMVDCTVRCPWHHARFDLRTGEAIAAPALNNVACYNIEKRGERFFATGKVDKKSERPKASPASVMIIGAGAAGGAAPAPIIITLAGDAFGRSDFLSTLPVAKKRSPRFSML